MKITGVTEESRSGVPAAQIKITRESQWQLSIHFKVKEGSDPFSPDQNLFRVGIRSFYRKGSEPLTGQGGRVTEEDLIKNLLI